MSQRSQRSQRSQKSQKSRMEETGRDQVSLGPLVAPGVRAVARKRAHDGEIEFGAVRALREGQPIPENMELIRVDNPTCTCGGWQDVESLGTVNGPAQVATPKYREGYDRIFGGKATVGSA